MEPEASNPEADVLHSVKTFAAANPAFTEPSIRWLIFRFKNELLEQGAITYAGNKLIIVGNKFAGVIKEGRLAA